MVHVKDIDRVRTKIWLAEIRSLTGVQGIHALASLLDAESTWRDDGGIPHQSKWYRYDCGSAVPSKALADKVKKRLPALSFEIHHPVWSLLRHPVSSPRTIERLIKKMAAGWRQALEKLIDEEFEFRRINLEVVDRYNLAAFSYLDALLLLELARRNACIKHAGKDEDLAFILLALPLLYIGDPFWVRQGAEQRKETLRTIVHSLKCSGDYFSRICFPADRLVQAMDMQRVLCEAHKRSHPRALSSSDKKIRFLAKCLGSQPEGRYAIATSAFIRENQFQRRVRSFIWGADPYAQSVWEWAWNCLEREAEFSHLAAVFPSRRAQSS